MPGNVRTRNPIGLLVSVGALVGLVLPSGCGVLAAKRTQFANQAETADGRELFVEDINEILEDELLTPEQKHDRLGMGNEEEGIEGLGIEDEDLIEALLSLSAPQVIPL